MISPRTCVQLLVAALLLLPALLQARDDGVLRGEAFSDPAARQPVEKGWEELAIRHLPEDAGADLVVNLNQQFYEVIAGPIRDYARQRGLQISIHKGTCGLSAGMLQKKTADIGSFCCPPGETDRLPGLRYHTVGIHAISIITHRDNPVEGLSTEDVRSAFQGSLARWPETGGQGSLVRVVTRPHCRKRPGHWKLILKDPELFSIDAREVGAIEDMFTLVAGTSFSLGYEVVREGSSYGGDVKVLKVDGYHPDDLQALARGDYPFYRVLSLASWEDAGRATALSNDLVDFITAELERNGADVGIVSVSRLKAAGWRFVEGELAGEPGEPQGMP